MAKGYGKKNFKLEKEWYSYLYQVLSDEGPDKIHRRFLEGCEKDRDWISYVVGEMAEQLTGLHQALVIAGTNNDPVEDILKSMKSKEK